MDIKFLGQGLVEQDRYVGDIILESFKDERYDNFICLVAFATEAGLNRIIQDYNSFTTKKGNKSTLYIGVDQGGTPKDALELLLTMGHEVFVYYNSNNSVIFHPKIYMFSGKECHRIIIGSSNLTVTGLFQNIESSVLVDFNADDENGLAFYKEIKEYFNELLDNSNENLKLLTAELIEKLVSSGIVPKKSIHSNPRIKSGSLAETETHNIKDIFPLAKVPKAPERTILSDSEDEDDRTLITKDTAEDTTTDTTVSTSLIGVGRTIWFQSGKLTGGSANILDLSLQGKNGGIGGVQLLNPSLHNNHSITINYENVDYFDNIIKYPLTATGESNGSWRLQMKGISQQDDRFTAHTRQGQLKDKILLFEEIGPDHYILTTKSDIELENHKNTSTFFEQSPPRGRFYGKI